MRGRPATRKRSISRFSGDGASPGLRSSRTKVFCTNFLRSFFALLFLALTSACAVPSIHSRPVQEEPTWFVRLDSVDPVDRRTVGYQHPATWSERDLFAILSRLFLEQRVGLMDDPRPVRQVFSREELQHIVPSVREAFHTAMPQEWVAFTIVQPSGTENHALTSGGLFLEADRLHIVVANHRTILPTNSPERLKVRHNPLYSVNGSGGILGLEPRRYVLSTKANWSGGYRASANEMVLDHVGLLASINLSDRMESTRLISPSGPPGLPQTLHSNVESTAEATTSDPAAAIHRLEGEIEHLKRQLADKQREVERLKANSLGQPTGR